MNAELMNKNIITNSEQLFVYTYMSMEETVAKKKTLCHWQNVY